MKQFYVKTSEDSQTRKTNKFILPLMKTEFGKAANFYQTIKMWNILPDHIINAATLHDFDKLIRELLIKCRENQFVFMENRILNSFVIKGNSQTCVKQYIKLTF